MPLPTMPVLGACGARDDIEITRSVRHTATGALHRLNYCSSHRGQLIGDEPSLYSCGMLVAMYLVFDRNEITISLACGEKLRRLIPGATIRDALAFCLHQLLCDVKVEEAKRNVHARRA